LILRQNAAAIVVVMPLQDSLTFPFYTIANLLKFLRYVEKKWALQGELRSASKSADMMFEFKDLPADGVKSGINRNRRLSLEESILVNHMAQVRPPIARSHEVFMFYTMFNPS
jgi:hypothetical protein